MMKQRGSFSAFLIGGQSLLIRCAETLLEKGHVVKGVISSDPDVAQWCQKRGLLRFTPSADLSARLAEHPFDYLFSVVNLTVLPDSLLALPQKGAINFHDGPLPAYAGLNAPTWALINRESRHGVTWHAMTRRVDAGGIFQQRRFSLTSDETALSLNAKCFEAAWDSFGALVDELAEGRVTPRPQPLTHRSFYPRRRRPHAACLLDWGQPAETLDALARALTYGPYPNPLGLPKLWLGDETVEAVIVGELRMLPTTSVAAPGTVLELNDRALKVATKTRDLELSSFSALSGRPLSAEQLKARLKRLQRPLLPRLEASRAEALSALNEAWAKHEPFWEARLAHLEPLELPYLTRSAPETSGEKSSAASTKVSYTETTFASRTLPLITGDDVLPGDRVVAAHALYFARLSGKESIDLPFQSASLRRELGDIGALFASHIPLRVNLGMGDFQTFFDAFADQLRRAEVRRSYARDLPLRHPLLRDASALWHREMWSVALEREDEESCKRDVKASNRAALTVIIPDSGYECVWRYDPSVLRAEVIARMQAQLEALLNNLAASPHASVTALSILSTEDKVAQEAWNATALEYPRGGCIHESFEVQAARTPEATAVVFRETALTYGSLNAKANQLARALKGRGVRTGTRVAVLLGRGPEMVVALLGVLKAGAAYVPLDPTYPEERLRFMLGDAQVAALVSQTRFQPLLTHPLTIALDAEEMTLAQESPRNLGLAVPLASLAYVIYTSGSTGTPKGVMVEHRNVMNFFAGMDARLGTGASGTGPGVWLAVTSISFDISVLELFWTLTRGFKVVLYADENRAEENHTLAARPPLRHADEGLDFSLFYFSSAEANGEGRGSPYELLLEGAKFADEHGFTAVWTPERHFHDFGGLYPNPAVTAAALAMVTRHVQLRAGSCVLPLHHPARVAEEWALVDNLSGGRVGLSFASGWQPDDFILTPQNYEGRHALMEKGIETVRALWRGETVSFPGPKGEVEVRTLPRPLQTELPTWITAAGNPDTFRKAGEMGANLLTHLLGQSVQELAEKLALYREAWRRGGHPGEGYVSLMLHTFIAEDDAFVRAQVHAPLKAYLGSATGLLKQYASSFPAFKRARDEPNGLEAEVGAGSGDGFGDLSESDLDALLEHAFERYYTTSGLFGTPESCLSMLDNLKGIGVADVACLIDFGVPSKTALAHLSHLDQLRRLANTPEAAQPNSAAKPTASYTVPDLIERHGVTHLQCTPSLAKMLTLEPDTRRALRPLKQMLVGGEALEGELAATLRALVSGDVFNMYGPTETTVWSTSHRLSEESGSVPLGTPIANTRVYILDARLQPLPVGVPGELVIAGEGVVRGYLNRPETTAERFLPDPFGGGGKMYRTGDLARYRADGTLEFLGRTDYQVKLRGYRIELGEIEAVLSRHPAVQQAAVIAREDAPGDVRLVAYIVREAVYNASLPSADALQRFFQGYLKSQLPEYMIPAAFVVLETFPLTPNKKVDRRALPVPEYSGRALSETFVSPRTPHETLLAEVWERVLGVRVGVHDNFFELGGNSLLALHAMSQTSKAGLNLSLQQLFRYPTVEVLAQKLDQQAQTPAQHTEQGVVTGSFPLPPSHHRFFYERNSPDSHHWNHAFLLGARCPLEPAHLEVVVKHLLHHHDALRLQFKREASGWRPSLAALEDTPVPFTSVDLSLLPKGERVAALERTTAELQGSLDLSKGPLVRVAHFDLGPDEHRLFVTMHHLVVDPISWRIFWEDLQTAYRQVSLGEPIRLSPKTTSYRAWSEALQKRAQAEARSASLEPWLSLPWSSVRPLPLDYPNDRFRDNLNASFGVVTSSLSAAATHALLEHTRRGVYHTEEVLITALVKTFAPWTKSPLLLDMVSLSRFEDLDATDLSRTLGYFVAYVPLLVSLERELVPEQALASVAEQLRRITPMARKHDLLRYLCKDEGTFQRLAALPRAEVLFNYRDKQEHDLSFLDASLFQTAAESKGPSHSPRGLRHHPLNLAGDVLGDRLQFTFTFSRNLHRPATIQQLADTLANEVQSLTQVLGGLPYTEAESSLLT